VLATSDAKTTSTPPVVVVNGDVTTIVKVAVPLPVTSIVASLFWTFPAGAASDPPFAAG
jgi:hypothetical protein